MFSLRDRFELSVMSFVPVLVTLLLLVLCSARKYAASLAECVPLVPLVPIYFWVIYRPRSMPYWLVFLAGGVQDILLGMPLGISSLLLMLFRSLAVSQRRVVVREGFAAMWFFFAALALMVALLYWLVMSLFYLVSYPLEPALMQWVLSVGLYPLLHRFCFGVHEATAKKNLLALDK